MNMQLQLTQTRQLLCSQADAVSGENTAMKRAIGAREKTFREASPFN